MDAVEALAAAAGIELSAGPGPNWETVERSLDGLSLPSDYKRLVDRFPHGRFKELVMVIRPGIQGGSWDDYLGYYASRLDTIRAWRAGGFGTYPYPLYPEEGGLLPWGASPRSSLFFWLTEGADPDAWTVVWADKAYEKWGAYPATMSEFLLRVVNDSPAEMAELAAGDLTTNPAFRAFGPGYVVERPRE